MHIPVHKYLAGKIHPNVLVRRRLGSSRGTLYAFVLSDVFIRAYLGITSVNPLNYA